MIVVSGRGRLIIGRAEDKADVLFDGTPSAPNMVSRAHAAVTCGRAHATSAFPFAIQVTDLNSVNGVLVDGVKVSGVR